MAYSDFTLRDAVRKLNLTLTEATDLFGQVAEIDPGGPFVARMAEYVPLALAINTEKARSELIIMPLLVEVWKRAQARVSLFSGIDFPAAPEKGLVGVCDFLLTLSSEQQFVAAPVLTIVEAKNDNPKSGLGQCIASMVGARIFNEREGTPAPIIFGAVTTGTLWRFLTLSSPAGTETVTLDQHEYHIERLPKILGVLVHAVAGSLNQNAL